MIALTDKAGSITLKLHAGTGVFTASISDDRAPSVVKLVYLGRDGAHALRQYARYVDNAKAQHAIAAWGRGA